MSSKLTFDELKQQLWYAADILDEKGGIDPNEYRKPILGMLFLKRLNDVFEDGAKELEKKIGVQTGKISLKNQKNRWGSLSKKGTINFNQNLVRAPQKIIEYVVAHEVCHLKIPNHSRAYWRLLSSVMPDYEDKKDWLRVNRISLMD